MGGEMVEGIVDNGRVPMLEGHASGGFPKKPVATATVFCGKSQLSPEQKSQLKFSDNKPQNSKAKHEKTS